VRRGERFYKRPVVSLSNHWTPDDPVILFFPSIGRQAQKKRPAEAERFHIFQWLEN